MAIESFKGEYHFLSNFHPVTIRYEGIEYPSVEHAFQAAKTFDVEQRASIAALPTAAKAKRAGRRVDLRSDWNEIRVDVMRQLLKLKFKDPQLRSMLLATGEELLEEGNYWNDRFWGICKGSGENHLGLLLMEIREQCRQSQEAAPKST